VKCDTSGIHFTSPPVDETLDSRAYLGTHIGGRVYFLKRLEDGSCVCLVGRGADHGGHVVSEGERLEEGRLPSRTLAV